MIMNLFALLGIGVFVGFLLTIMLIVLVYYTAKKRVTEIMDGIEEYEIYDMTNSRYLVKGSDLKEFYKNNSFQDYIAHIGQQLNALAEYDAQTLSRLKITYPKNFEKVSGKQSGLYKGFVDENKVLHLEKIEENTEVSQNTKDKEE